MVYSADFTLVGGIGMFQKQTDYDEGVVLSNRGLNQKEENNMTRLMVVKYLVRGMLKQLGEESIDYVEKRIGMSIDLLVALGWSGEKIPPFRTLVEDVPIVILKDRDDKFFEIVIKMRMRGYEETSCISKRISKWEIELCPEH